MTDDEASQSEDNTTRTAQTRWDYTNDLITIIIVVNIMATWWAFLYAISTGVVDLSNIGSGPIASSVADPLIGKALAVGLAAMFIWLYGDGLVDAYLRIRGRK
jgi:hypothetical protein